MARAWRVRVRTRNAWRRPHSPEAPCRCASQSDTRFKRAPTFRLTTRSAQPHPFGSDGPARQSIANRYHVRLDTNRSDMPAKTSLTLDDSDARGHLAPNLAESVRQSLRAECSNPSANSSSFGITLTILSTSDAKLLANQLERRTRKRHQPAKTSTRGNARNPASPRERSPPGPPHLIGRCSRAGRSRGFVTQIIHAIVSASPGLSQPRNTRPWHSGTTGCSRNTRPRQHGDHAWNALHRPGSRPSTNSAGMTPSGQASHCTANEAFEQRATTLTGRGRR